MLLQCFLFKIKGEEGKAYVNTEEIGYIDFSFIYFQIDIILRALELYAYNFNFVVPVDKDSDLQDLRMSLIFHAYHEILSKYGNHKEFIKGNLEIENTKNFYIKNKKRNYYKNKK